MIWLKRRERGFKFSGKKCIGSILIDIVWPNDNAIRPEKTFFHPHQQNY